MDNPQQFLIHLSNRGSTVVSEKDGKISNFKLHTRTPFKDINKYGLLHYSIPRSIDTISTLNNKFTINLIFGTDTVPVEIELPLADYYSMLISQPLFESGRFRVGNQIAFDEFLQVCINAAIQKTYASYNLRGTSMWGQVLLNRIGCVVKRDVTTGLFSFDFGFRQHYFVSNSNSIAARRYNVNAANPNSGDPQDYFNCIDFFGRPVDVTRMISTPTNAINPVSQAPIAQMQPASDPLKAQLAGVDSNGNKTKYPETANLSGVEFVIPSERLKFMLGTVGGLQTEIITGTRLISLHGCVSVRKYNVVGAHNTRKNLDIVKYTCESRPNLEPPAFMYLNLLVAGTRSKVLGQRDERAGWAIPTPPEMYMSMYVNFPYNKNYHVNNVRHMPIATSRTRFNTNFVANTALTAQGALQKGRLGNAFDPIPFNAMVADPAAAQQPAFKVNIVNFTTLYDQVTAAQGSFYAMDNFSVVSNSNYNYEMSGHIYMGLFDRDGNYIKPQLRDVRSDGIYNGKFQRGFKAGPAREPSVFTMSMVMPNYIYTQTENLTMQTIDLQLLFSDTSEVVEADAPQPVQISLIASS